MIHPILTGFFSGICFMFSCIWMYRKYLNLQKNFSVFSAVIIVLVGFAGIMLCTMFFLSPAFDRRFLNTFVIGIFVGLVYFCCYALFTVASWGDKYISHNNSNSQKS